MNSRDIAAVFFDRDGVVNERIIGGYVSKISDFHFNPGFFNLFATVKSNFPAILITNQQGIGKKIMTVEELEIIHSFMQTELKKNTGFRFDDIYYCPDLDGVGSFRRKPNPGMILEAIEKWGISPEKSYMIGDSIKDYLAGKAAGTKTILIGEFDKMLIPDITLIVKDLFELNDYFDSLMLR